MCGIAVFHMHKSASLLIAVAIASIMLPSSVIAQSSGTYKLLAAGTSGSEKGLCAIGTATITSDKTLTFKSKNPTDSSPAQTFKGKATKNPFTVFGPNSQKVRIRIIHSGQKYIYGTYTRFKGSKEVASGEYSLTRK
jgi:hypothetical protein